MSKKQVKKAAPKAKKQPEPKPKEEIKKPESLYGKEITVKNGDVEYKGICTCERTVNGGDQVFLKLNGIVSRWFYKKDIA